jgi:hypothetical protein
MSYGLRGYDGRVHGLGDFDPPDRPVWVDPGYPPDPAIVAANTQKNNEYQVAIAGAQAQNNLDQCLANAENATPGAQRDSVLASCGQAYSDAGAYAAQTAATPVTWYSGGGSPVPFEGNQQATAALAAQRATPAAPRGGQLTFTSSRGGTALQVGDTWMVAITGASPNSPVTASGSMPGSSFSGTAMGSTDSNGNFSKSGQVGTGEIGSWSEQWAVGGAPSGAFSFSVSAAPPYVSSSVPPTVRTPVPTSPLLVALPGGFDLSSIPWWGWLAAGGVALFAFGGGRGR